MLKELGLQTLRSSCVRTTGTPAQCFGARAAVRLSLAGRFDPQANLVQRFNTQQMTARARSAKPTSARMQTTSEQAHEERWRSLRTKAEELRLDFTLPTGQTFRWRLTAPGEYVGIVGQRAVRPSKYCSRREISKDS